MSSAIPELKSVVTRVQNMHGAYWSEEQIELATRTSARLIELTAAKAAGLDVESDLTVVTATAETIAQGEARLVGQVINQSIIEFLGGVIRATVLI